jgi:hypothetical protein
MNSETMPLDIVIDLARAIEAEDCFDQVVQWLSECVSVSCSVYPGSLLPKRIVAIPSLKALTMGLGIHIDLPSHEAYLAFGTVQRVPIAADEGVWEVFAQMALSFVDTYIVNTVILSAGDFKRMQRKHRRTQS